MNSDARAVNMATPALGPSLGTAPAGTCTWTSLSASNFGSIFNLSARERTNVKAAVADSFITSPICPVSMIPPLPGIREASMKRISPPTGV